ncbi:type 1 glutamine amidotransferase [Acuticoccus mangrovi]|uniref:Type 1 glutamine amidotransferase n=1 Tax=Acuticoccus mangrovi TaxID=2796142 RepID=A0A934IVG7_9HYPH|nr:type 1 glutamine amidotransferase [Acuticoccus mangrovi]MBJ3778479.1 type 1 glutamine amidotransferase [Acuticoccus mangrovi]
MTTILALASAYHMETFEAGSIGRAVEAAGGRFEWRNRRLGEAMPDSHEGYDGIVVFGGEMAVYEAEYRPYFSHMEELVRSFHAAGKPVLGSCLGAQVIAHAFGAKVYRAGVFECGFTPLVPTAAAADDPLLAGTPSPVHLFEMHGDTFDLPDGAVPLLAGGVVANQAFRLGAATYAFQCHHEVTPEIVGAWNARIDEHNPTFFADLGGPDPRARQPADFARYQAAQEAFALKVTAAWMDKVKARLSLPAEPR